MVSTHLRFGIFSQLLTSKTFLIAAMSDRTQPHNSDTPPQPINNNMNVIDRNLLLRPARTQRFAGERLVQGGA
jgi:hypothetical protein